MKFLSVALLVLKKDFAIEMRSYEILSTTLFFAVACVAIFSFAFVKEGQAEVDAAAGRVISVEMPVAADRGMCHLGCLKDRQRLAHFWFQ